MSKSLLHSVILSGMILCFAFSNGCTPPWPDSPLYEPPVNDPNWTPPATLEEAMGALEGHYAHYDIVAYIAQVPTGLMRTFIISYGFTDFTLEDGELVEFDRFCHAEHKANQPFVTTFNDAATQAIEPRTAVVDVYQEDGNWKVWRPATPTLIGIDGDPDVPLSMDPNDPNINDDDGDGKPGITVGLTLYGSIEAELYIARREIFQNDLTLYSDGSLHGHVVDESEQLVIGASLAFLNKPNNPIQHEDPGLSPMMLIPVSDDLDTCEELMANRDSLFPPEPAF
jgi:hypothetical protein